jgi:membrane-bound lytic murein transglycosylase
MAEFNEKQFEKDLAESMEKANAEIMEEFEQELKEFQETDYGKEIQACKVPEDFLRVTKKYHPEWFKDGVIDIR